MPHISNQPSVDPWIIGIKQAGEDMIKEYDEIQTYVFHLSCGSEVFREVVRCSPAMVRDELTSWVENLITYSAVRVGEGSDVDVR